MSMTIEEVRDARLEAQQAIGGILYRLWEKTGLAPRNVSIEAELIYRSIGEPQDDDGKPRGVAVGITLASP